MSGSLAAVERYCTTNGENTVPYHVVAHTMKNVVYVRRGEHRAKDPITLGRSIDTHRNKSIKLLRLGNLNSTPLDRVTIGDPLIFDQATAATLDDYNRLIRDRFVSERSPLRRDDVIRMVGGVMPDGEKLLRLWQVERTVLAVTHLGTVYYPSFQFQDGLPLPIVKTVLDALPSEMSDWQRALWFVSANGWTHNEAPVDHLDDAALLLRAAGYEGEPVIG